MPGSYATYTAFHTAVTGNHFLRSKVVGGMTLTRDPHLVPRVTKYGFVALHTFVLMGRSLVKVHGHNIRASVPEFRRMYVNIKCFWESLKPQPQLQGNLHQGSSY
jgi:hypothetical protein